MGNRVSKNVCAFPSDQASSAFSQKCRLLGHSRGCLSNLDYFLPTNGLYHLIPRVWSGSGRFAIFSWGTPSCGGGVGGAGAGAGCCC